MRIPGMGLLAFTAFATVASMPGAPFPAAQSSVNQARPTDPSKSVVDRATGLALQGDSAAAIKLLSESASGNFQGEDATFRACMLDRFGSPSLEVGEQNFGDPRINSLATNYLKYWNHSLTKPAEREQAEDTLRNEVGRLLGRTLSTSNDFDSAEDEVKKQALRRGYHVLLGRTQPLRELMLWKTLTVEQRTANLPEGPQSVEVTYLDDFLLRGWGYYATCGRRSAGGWATEDGLFAVVPAYKSLNDETFSVRFLAHETQHFADKKAFPNLESWELEYRAKLVELALADASQASTLQLICENRSETKTSSHGYADTHVVNDVTRRLELTPADMCEKKTVAGQVLRDAAKAVLLEDSRKRREK